MDAELLASSAAEMLLSELSSLELEVNNLRRLLTEYDLTAPRGPRSSADYTLERIKHHITDAQMNLAVLTALDLLKRGRRGNAELKGEA